ncbi:TIGR04255 family protein [Arthrobacter sulfonylureivorans]|uniref:TIGR04255 family protein n=1 Tax=Arthrobacter sulfonylureivorans TaxID=2486855 RepID=A0ABY3W8W2_9MICC|nr:TIGR04255 family protein [Arthrobacter sulfonylureivorans]UNK45665.1 TIGR04255 family protein [Arthrobacter sulfonylureivorans]
MTSTVNPYGITPVDEIQLTNAPLLKVLCQVRWPQYTPISAAFDGIGDKLASALAADYPLRSSQQEMTVTLTPAGPTQNAGKTLLQFSSLDEDWTVTFGESHLTLETNAYVSRVDFMNRFRRVLAGLQEIVAMPHANRVGFRYINRIDNSQDYGDLESLVVSPVLGASAIEWPGAASMQHSINEALYTCNQARLVTRWAKLPAGGTIDPTIEPSNSNNWTLDLDAFSEEKKDFNPDFLIQTASDLASLAYSFFRAIIKDEFITRFGGAK